MAAPEIHDFTARWWASLPDAYRAADAVQGAEDGAYPLRRWLEGIGSVAGAIRDVSDDLWDGVYTDPARVPDGAPLRWLGQMLGAPAAQRSGTDAALRQYLVDLAGIGRPALGSRRAIYEVAKYFLTGTRQVAVVPSTTPHRIVMLVRSDEVPGGNLAALVASVRASGAVPAGHELTAQAVISTWDSFAGAVGASWDELEGKVRTWNESDSLGVVLE